MDDRTVLRVCLTPQGSPGGLRRAPSTVPPRRPPTADSLEERWLHPEASIRPRPLDREETLREEYVRRSTLAKEMEVLQATLRSRTALLCSIITVLLVLLAVAMVVVLVVVRQVDRRDISSMQERMAENGRENGREWKRMQERMEQENTDVEQMAKVEDRLKAVEKEMNALTKKIN